MTQFSILLLLLTGCSTLRPADRTPEASDTLSFPSELPPESALQLARNVLVRAGWPAAERPKSRTFMSDWHAAGSDSLRLVMTAADVDRGASTVVMIWGEARVDGQTVGVTRDAAAWPTVERIAQQVGAGVRHALY